MHRFAASIVAVFLLAETTLGATMPAVTRPATSQFVTRSEAVMILLQARLKSIPPIPGGEWYPDVVRGTPSERYLVLAARYGILEPEAGTNRLYPNVPVNRAGFVKMLARTFSVKARLPQRYRDVQPRMWFAPYAGVAELYAIFPDDRDQTLFKPGNLLTPGEVARAVQILAQNREKETVPVEVMIASTGPSADAISTRQESMTMVMMPGVTNQPAAGWTLPKPTSSSPQQMMPLFSQNELRNQIIALVNRERTKRGIRALALNTFLEGSAQLYAEALALKGFFAHTSPTGETFRDRIGNSGFIRPTEQDDCFCVRRFVLGENLAKGQLTAADVVRDWLASPAHRAALLSTQFTDTGIGIAAGLWVAHFGGVERVDQ